MIKPAGKVLLEDSPDLRSAVEPGPKIRAAGEEGVTFSIVGGWG